MPTYLKLRAGAIELEFNLEDASIRQLYYEGEEFLRGAYIAVRDHNWGTVKPRIKRLEHTIKHNRFNIEFEVECIQDQIKFFWDGSISGDYRGIHYSFYGKARSNFQRNRIGFCVLHPPELAGKACTITTIEGKKLRGKFPKSIAPHQPFLNLFAIAHQVSPGVTAEVMMIGDTFEMEDQRNWTDGSYKTYCTPLARPFPVVIPKGTEISQSITIALKPSKSWLASPPPRKPKPRSNAVELTSGKARPPLPSLGTVWNILDPSSLDEQIWQRLSALRLSHLRLDLKLAGKDWKTRLHSGLHAAAKLGLALELVLHVSDKGPKEVAALLKDLATANPPATIARWIVLQQGVKCSDGRLLKQIAPLIRKAKFGGAIGSGTDAYFAEINRGQPQADGMDFGAYSINPQVHAFDDRSLIETVSIQGVTVRDAMQLIEGKPIVVSPITLRPRFNPNATGTAPTLAPGELPPTVDPRQVTAFGAVWTLGSLKHLANAGAQAVTYYDAVGMTGLMADGSSTSANFAGKPGHPFPLYHVLAWAGIHQGAITQECTSTKPLQCDALLIKTSSGWEALMANYTAEPREIILNLPDNATLKEVQIVDFASLPDTTQLPHIWDHLPWTPLKCRLHRARLTLPAHGLARCRY